MPAQADQGSGAAAADMTPVSREVWTAWVGATIFSSFAGFRAMSPSDEVAAGHR
jgi:hypothetical protein